MKSQPPDGEERSVIVMHEDVVRLLAALGVPGAAEDPLLEYIINDVSWRLKNETNQAEIPDGLNHAAVNMAAGEYINMKRDCGALEGFDLEAAVKQIQEGDTNITFALGDGSMTPEQRLDNLIAWLINGSRNEIFRYRRLVW